MTYYLLGTYLYMIGFIAGDFAAPGNTARLNWWQTIAMFVFAPITAPLTVGILHGFGQTRYIKESKKSHNGIHQRKTKGPIPVFTNSGTGVHDGN